MKINKHHIAIILSLLCWVSFRAPAETAVKPCLVIMANFNHNISGFTEKHTTLSTIKVATLKLPERFYIPGPRELAERYYSDRSFIMVFTLFMVILYSIATMLVLLAVLLLNRQRLERKAKTNQYLKEKFQAALIDFLYGEDLDKNEIKTRLKSVAGNQYNKQFLINEIIDLSVNLKGEIAARLQQLYFELGLDKITFKKVYSRKWHLKIKGFRELAFMNVKNAKTEIEKALHSKNDILRMEAQIALVRLNENEPFHFLDKLEKPFSKWEQMNIHELMVYHDLKTPEFNKWARSKNKTVAMFAINMIKVFKQKEIAGELIQLLDDKNDEIRKTTINCLGALKAKEALSPLKSHFAGETYDNKLEILKALQISTDEANKAFLKWVLENENDVHLQVEAAKAIRNIGESGINELNELVKSDEYRNYQIILLHVLDKRI